MKGAMGEVTALLQEFVDSDFRSMHLRTARYELFLAKPGGGPNPLLEPTADEVEATHELLRAPHVATVVSSVAIGARVAAATPVVLLDLLGEKIELASGVDGVIDAVLVEPGEFVEFETPLLRIARADG